MAHKTLGFLKGMGGLRDERGSTPLILSLIVAAGLTATAYEVMHRTATTVNEAKSATYHDRAAENNVSSLSYAKSLMAYAKEPLPGKPDLRSVDQKSLPYLYPDPYFNSKKVLPVQAQPSETAWSFLNNTLQLSIVPDHTVKAADFANLVQTGQEKNSLVPSRPTSLQFLSPRQDDPKHPLVVTSYEVKSVGFTEATNDTPAKPITSEGIVPVEKPAPPVCSVTFVDTNGNDLNPKNNPPVYPGSSQALQIVNPNQAMTMGLRIAGVADWAKVPTKDDIPYGTYDPRPIDITKYAGSVSATGRDVNYSWTVTAPRTLAAVDEVAYVDFPVNAVVHGPEGTTVNCTPAIMRLYNKPTCHIQASAGMVLPGQSVKITAMPWLKAPANAPIKIELMDPSDPQHTSTLPQLVSSCGQNCAYITNPGPPQNNGNSGNGNGSGNGNTDKSGGSSCLTYYDKQSCDGDNTCQWSNNSCVATNDGSECSGYGQFSCSLDSLCKWSKKQYECVAKNTPNNNGNQNQNQNQNQNATQGVPQGEYTVVGTINTAYGPSQCLVHVTFGPNKCRFFSQAGYGRHCETETLYVNYFGSVAYMPFPFCPGQPLSSAQNSWEVSGYANSPVDTANCPNNARCFAFNITDGANGNYQRTPFVIVDNATSASCQPWVATRINLGCFAAETKVRMADGSDREVTQIKKGDLLWNPLRAKGMAVKRTSMGSESKPLVVIKTADASLRVTTQHPMMTRRGLVMAQAVTTTDEILGADGKYHQVVSAMPEAKAPDRGVFNFELDAPSDDPRDHAIQADGVVTGDLFIQETLAKAPYTM